LQNFVDKRFKPTGAQHMDPHQEIHSVEQRLDLLEQRLAAMESGRAPSEAGEE
jgi:hypothetical protein